MTTDYQTLRRQELGEQLRKLRNKKYLKLDEAAWFINCSGSKLSASKAATAERRLKTSQSCWGCIAPTISNAATCSLWPATPTNSVGCSRRTQRR